MTAILGQSQPRISRHLKLLTDAGLVDRLPEGAWAFYRLTDAEAASRMTRDLLTLADPADPVLLRDAERLAEIKRERAGIGIVGGERDPVAAQEAGEPLGVGG